MPKAKNYVRGLLLVAALVLLSWGAYECNYQVSWWQDYQRRPWAYSRDPQAKLLVGTWKGQYQDPNGVAKDLVLTVVEPLTDAERRKKAGGRQRRRGRREWRLFSGAATVTSRLGREDYRLHGAVRAEDSHQLTMQFGAKNEATRLQPNFALNLVQTGSWANDRMTLQIGFTYFKANGSSFSDSSDPRYGHIATVVLQRQRTQ